MRLIDFHRILYTVCHYFKDQNGSKDGYENAFNELMTKKLKRHNLSDLFISVDVINEDGSDWLDVHGIDIKTNRSYAIEFYPWSDWASIFIMQETLDTLSKEDIVAGCLYEMTFNGFSEKTVNEAREKLVGAFEEMKDNKC